PLALTVTSDSEVGPVLRGEDVRALPDVEGTNDLLERFLRLGRRLVLVPQRTEPDQCVDSTGELAVAVPLRRLPAKVRLVLVSAGAGDLQASEPHAHARRQARPRDGTAQRPVPRTPRNGFRDGALA